MTKSAFVLTLLLGLAISAISQVSNPKKTVSPAIPPNPPGDFPHNCDGMYFPLDKGGSPSCCQKDNDIFHLVEMSPFRKRIGHRTIGPVCSDQLGHPTCTGTDCYFGPCGASHAEIWDGNLAEIFLPKTVQPKVCGYQVSLGRNIIVSSPERYSDQTLFDGVTASCYYGTCLDGGRRANTFSITIVEANATGMSTLQPGNFTLLGGASLSWVREQGDVTLTAKPTGSLAQAKFSGACNTTGKVGETITCNIPMAPNPEVTLTYFPCSNLGCEIEVNQPVNH